MTVDDLDPHKCTIYIYTFAKLDPSTYKMDVFDSWLDISLKVRTSGESSLPQEQSFSHIQDKCSRVA